MRSHSKNGIGPWQVVGFGFTSLVGTLLHFLYDLTGENVVAALFSGVNESTWEHMKLLFFPLFAFAVIESFFVGRDYDNFWCVKLRGTLLGLVLIPVLFYTLNGALGKTPDFVNIAIFFASAAATYLCETKRFAKGSSPCRYKKWAIVAFCAIAAAFWVFTFKTPELPIFRDPLDGTYGISK